MKKSTENVKNITDVLNRCKYPDVASSIVSCLYKRLFRGSLGWGNRPKTFWNHVKQSTNCSEATFFYSLDELVKRDLITKEPRHRYTLYEIRPKTVRLVKKYLESKGIDNITFLSSY